MCTLWYLKQKFKVKEIPQITASHLCCRTPTCVSFFWMISAHNETLCCWFASSTKDEQMWFSWFWSSNNTAQQQQWQQGTAVDLIYWSSQDGRDYNEEIYCVTPGQYSAGATNRCRCMTILVLRVVTVLWDNFEGLLCTIYVLMKKSKTVFCVNAINDVMVKHSASCNNGSSSLSVWHVLPI